MTPTPLTPDQVIDRMTSPTPTGKTNVEYVMAMLAKKGLVVVEATGPDTTPTTDDDDIRGGLWWTLVVLALALVFEAGRWCLHHVGVHRFCHHIRRPTACPQRGSHSHPGPRSIPDAR